MAARQMAKARRDMSNSPLSLRSCFLRKSELLCYRLLINAFKPVYSVKIGQFQYVNGTRCPLSRELQ